jgi:energy-converting hydrogenase Eha subunit F
MMMTMLFIALAVSVLAIVGVGIGIFFRVQRKNAAQADRQEVEQEPAAPDDRAQVPDISGTARMNESDVSA